MSSPRTRARPAILLLCGILAALASGCGDRAQPPETDASDATRLRVEIHLTYHRGEAPVQVPRTVEIPVGPEATDTAPTLLLTEALEALLAGPSVDEREAGVRSFFSEETADLLRSVNIENGRAVVDFHDFRTVLPNVSASAGSLAFLTELNGTVFRNSLVEEAEYRLAGSCEGFWNFLQRDCTVVPRPTEA